MSQSTINLYPKTLYTADRTILVVYDRLRTKLFVLMSLLTRPGVFVLRTNRKNVPIRG